MPEDPEMTSIVSSTNEVRRRATGERQGGAGRNER